jgi:hypothetical protein
MASHVHNHNGTGAMAQIGMNQGNNVVYMHDMGSNFTSNIYGAITGNGTLGVFTCAGSALAGATTDMTTSPNTGAVVGGGTGSPSLSSTDNETRPINVGVNYIIKT